MDYKVSVIIPIYNASTFLEKSIISLFNQSLDEIEYIFVDDFSVDNSVEKLWHICNQFPLIKPHVKVINHDQNLGVSVARNTGLMEAKGSYIGWCDADDEIDPNMFKEMYNVAIEYNSDIVWCDYYNDFGTHKNYINESLEENSNSCIKAFLKGELIGSLWNKLYRRTLFLDNKISFPNGLNMSEDLRVNIQLFYFAQKIKYLPKAFYKYYKGRSDSVSSLSNINRNIIKEDRVENVKGIDNFLKEKGVQGVEYELGILKLMAKKSLLLTSDSVEGFKRWRDIFPESNKFMAKSHFPIHYKILAKMIEYDWWFIVRLWISSKKVITNK